MAVRDSQRSKVYKFDTAMGITFEPEKTLTLAAAHYMCQQIAAHYRLPKPGIGDGRGARRAFYEHNRYRIVLPRWARQSKVVLHEMAHLITYAYYGGSRNVADHGREFVGIYMWLLHKYANESITEMANHANALRVDFMPAHNGSYQALAKRRAA